MSAPLSSVSLHKRLKTLMTFDRSSPGTARSRLCEAQEEKEKARLEALLLEGLAGGRDIPLTRAFWQDLKAEAHKTAQKHKKRKKP